MNEVVNYINHLQKNIKELSDKRDELNNLSNILKKDRASASFTFHQSDGCVGIEITSGFREEEGLPVSKLPEILLEEGLEVVSCISTKVNGKLLHSMQCEVNSNSESVDLTELRRKISNVIQSFSCSD
uniref:BHLH domain-containing protein n=1 Tax=Lotus japonicus TaxID=34305 RepID=I3T2V7_LOTJA|nr:unknown [Lotus japonicus]